MHSLYPLDRVYADLIPGPEMISNDHLRQFSRLGFIVCAGVFGAERVASAKDALRELIARTEPRFAHVDLENVVGAEQASGPGREGYIRKLWSFVDDDARLHAMANDPALLSIVERLVASPVVLHQDMAMLKPPRVGREKPWHQDMAYFRLDRPDGVIGAWIALDPATPENGCMHAVPGSHLLGPQPHYHDRDCQLPDDKIAVDQSIVIPLSPGGVMFFHSLLHHGTPPNYSGERRWALQFHYTAAYCQKVSLEHHATFFNDAVGYAGCYPTRPISTRPVAARTAGEDRW
jgi:phytanoyl-CoA hydroxylase